MNAGTFTKLWAGTIQLQFNVGWVTSMMHQQQGTLFAPALGSGSWELCLCQNLPQPLAPWLHCGHSFRLMGSCPGAKQLETPSLLSLLLPAALLHASSQLWCSSPPTPPGRSCIHTAAREWGTGEAAVAQVQLPAIGPQYSFLLLGPGMATNTDKALQLCRLDPDPQAIRYELLLKIKCGYITYLVCLWFHAKYHKPSSKLWAGHTNQQFILQN